MTVSEAIGGSAPAIIGGGIVGGAYLSTLSAPALGASFGSALPGIGIAANIGLTTVMIRAVGAGSPAKVRSVSAGHHRELLS